MVLKLLSFRHFALVYGVSHIMYEHKLTIKDANKTTRKNEVSEWTKLTSLNELSCPLQNVY